MGNEVKHTPGPWEVIQDARLLHLVVARGYTLCRMADNGIANFGPEKANARLIAAAPDLLAACREVLRVAENAEENDEVALLSSSGALAEILKIAIGKATGSAD